MRSISKREKLEQFDGIKAQHDKLGLAMHDLINGKFSKPIRLNVRDYDPNWTGGFYTMRLSIRRSELLFLAVYSLGGQNDQVDVWTDSEILRLYDQRRDAVSAKMLMAGRLRLMADYAEQIREAA